MKKLLISCLAATAIGVGCASATALTNAAGQACEVIVTATNPTLAPLCVGAAQVAIAIETLIAANKADSGAMGAASPPTQDEIYAWLKAHGASTVKQ